MLASIIENVLNRGLPRSPRARQLCTELAGRRVAVEVRGVAELLVGCDGLALSIAAGSEGAEAAAADARVSGGLTALLALAARSDGSLRGGTIEVTGNAQIAERFHELVRLLRPDLEEELALAIGDVPAHRIARFARTALEWWRSAADTTVRNVAEYFAHERGDLVSRSEGRQLLAGIDAVREDIDRIEARIEALTRRIGAGQQGRREA
ncbi:MAG TPA: SCP2 sterol-binding domain-containing protein [Steroidobacteraceae bacterium]|nr:SCP2 sterol-binding domain-containing protein [Steroidobacteraceae bacterium]